MAAADGNETVTNYHGLKLKAAGGKTAGDARKKLESETGAPIITAENAATIQKQTPKIQKKFSPFF